MKVSEKEVDYVADLAHLELTAEERARMVKDLNSILEHIDQLSTLNTDGVEPMAQVMAGTAGGNAASDKFAFARRADDASARPSLAHDAAMQNAPERDADFFKVPKVIER